MLNARYMRSGELLGQWEVLNEVVVCRGMFVRPVTLWARVDGYLLATYVADGLIAATPTGSTAYALAAGGPILPPELRNILIVPVAPHLSVDRAIILAEGACVTITVRTSHEAVFSVDGQPPIDAGWRRYSGRRQRAYGALRSFSRPRLLLPQSHSLYGTKPHCRK